MRATLPGFALALSCFAAHAAPPPPAPAAATASADQQLRALYDAEWTWRQQEFAEAPDGRPTDRLPSVDAATQQRRAAYWQDALARLDRIDPKALSAEEQVNAAVFRTSLLALIDDVRFRAFEMPFNSDSNFWTGLAPRRLSSAEEARTALSRMRDLPRYFDEQIANMRAGLARGFTVPAATLGGRDASIAAEGASGDASPFHAAFAALPDSLPQRAALQAEARAVIARDVVPAYARLLAFMRDEYLPRARRTLAAEAMPDGKAFYQAQIRQYTTTPLTPAQIHAIGLEEVARIDREIAAVMAATGHTGTPAAFRDKLRTDPRFYARTPDELLGVSAYVAKRMDGELKNLFGLLPRYRFTIRPVPAAIAPFYTAGRGGLEACYMNTHNLPARPLFQIPALTLHECAPGHSFQAALAREAKARPAFRRETYFSGYGEGWGLYTEWLGKEAGIYRTPYEDYGRLSYEMWRAARLVIDTGIHHYGWSRERAIAYLLDRTALSRHEVETEVDRYISWPGQALAYKLGERLLRAKRAEAERVLGPKFDRRFFHDMILDLGSVPLDLLEAKINAWIAAGGPDTLGVGRAP